MMQHTITVEKNINRDRYSFTFILLVLIMAGIGIAVLYSGSLHYAERFFDDPSYFLVRQFRNLIAGSVGLPIYWQAVLSFCYFPLFRALLHRETVQTAGFLSVVSAYSRPNLLNCYSLSFLQTFLIKKRINWMRR